MSLESELTEHVEKIFDDQWEETDGRTVPAPENLLLGENDATKLARATVLYADLDGSTDMVSRYQWWKCAEVYKAYLHCTGKIIRAEGGTITSYDGDRVMAIFIGDNQSSSAAKCGLKINYAVKKIINPCFKKRYGDESFEIKHVTGIDASPIRAARTGIRGSNDIVWVGRAANYAAKLSALSPDFPTRITKTVYDDLSSDAKEGGTPRRSMWGHATWTSMNDMDIYRSTWTWSVS